MTLEEVMKELESLGTATTKKTLLRHGATEPLFGVRIGDMKPLQKRLKGQQELALQLFDTKNSDAMYLAGLIADGSKMSRKQLDRWASNSQWHMIASCSVAWVAVEHSDALKLATSWIDSTKELVAIAGWATLASAAAVIDDDRLQVDQFENLLERCKKSIDDAQNRVRYAMNNFVICVGTYVAPLAEKALAIARDIGVVEVELGNTACKVPLAEEYILKSRKGNSVAPKRKSVRC
jgi:3-methyladenine DNA glycosylase AlkD